MAGLTVPAPADGISDEPEAPVKDIDKRVLTSRGRHPRVHAEVREMPLAGRSLDEDQALELGIDQLVVGSLRRAETGIPRPAP